METYERRCSDRIRAIDIVEVDHRYTAIRSTFLTRLDAGLTPDASGSIDEEFVAVHLQCTLGRVFHFEDAAGRYLLRDFAARIERPMRQLVRGLPVGPMIGNKNGIGTYRFDDHRV